MTAATLGLLATAWVLLVRLRRPAVGSRPPAGRRRPSAPDHRRVPVKVGASGRAWWLITVVVAVVATVLGGPLVGGVVLAAPVMARRRRSGRRRIEAERAVIDQVPEVIDLLVLALGAGLTVTEAMAAVGRWAPGPVGDACAVARSEVGHGAPVAEALDRARSRCGPAAAGLFSALVAADRYGVPLGPSLDRLGHDARLDRRRAAEERARRVPVQLLFPLVVCVLPAFGLLTVVPLLVNSLGALAG